MNSNSCSSKKRRTPIYVVSASPPNSGGGEFIVGLYLTRLAAEIHASKVDNSTITKYFATK